MKKEKIEYIPLNLPERPECEYNFLCVSCFMGCEKLNIPKQECDRYQSWDLQGFLNDQMIKGVKHD